MNRDSIYYKQADLMVRMIPFVAEETRFALKGGTAINFFIRNMPRLSVDIDLTYLPLEDRNTSLKNISTALKRIAATIRKTHKAIKVQESALTGTKSIIKLFINAGGSVQIKIEPNLILRCPGPTAPAGYVRCKTIAGQWRDYAGNPACFCGLSRRT